MPDLDVFYAADPCYQAQARRRYGPLYRLTRRYRRYTALEAAVFGPASRTAILLISAVEMADYQHCYGTPPNRFHLLPPGINRNRMAPPDAPLIRAEVRQELGLTGSDPLVLLVGSDFRRKGLDRTLLALAALPAELRERTRLLVVGQAAARPFERLASQLGVNPQVRFLGGRDDVPRLLLGADLLVHPAYTECAGNVLLEAIIAGLPVLTTANCGYAFHVERAAAGRVVPVPFVQEQLNAALADMLTTPERERWAQNGIAYGHQADLYSRPQAALAVISQVVQEKGGR
jgi:UDP-glucose:(heptosyl)LPS alpha-1,3-glucosyltransferase